ncbi:MAG: potassium/chloride transporter 4/5/6 [Candidatus Krumholzibacteriia bacterium]
MTRKLGTFYGVYTPTILTILGVIMYLRFGWLVGHLGLGKVLPIVLLANVIAVITTLSFSAVASNTQVGAGGAYHVISRALGIEIGGAIGLPLFLSQAFSVTLYAYGLAESLRFVWPGLPMQLVTVVIILAVGLLAWLGAEKALKAQAPLLLLVAISIVALGVGALSKTGVSIPLNSGSGDIGFWTGFAIFFPAVTGVMAGLAMSGDLKDPMYSLPRGAFAAVATGLVIYIVVPVFLAIGATPEELQNDPMVWARIAPLGPILILPGLWAAIFSSAVGSILGAPRTLGALARDGLAPKMFGRIKNGQPDLVAPLFVSLVLALAAVFLGDLNTVAAVVTMFFLTVYGTVNFVAAFESLSGDPSWRPGLSSPWLINFLGGVACLAVMLLINPLAGVVAMMAELALYLLLSKRERQSGWSDARRGLYESLIRWALVQLANRPMTPRSWRPHILVFVDDIRTELDLVRFGEWFSQGRGVVTVCKLEVGDVMADGPHDLREQVQMMREVLAEEGVVAFPEVDMARNLVDGIVDVAQANGLAGISSNTVLLGWPSDPGLQVEFLRAMRRLEVLNKSLAFARVRPQLLYKRQGVERQVMIWWGGLQRNGDLMLLLTFLLTRNSAWRNARVSLMSLATTELMKQRTESFLKGLVDEIRIEADIKVLLKDPAAKVADIIREESRDAELVMLGLATPEKGKEAEQAERMEAQCEGLSNVFFVKNASLFVGDLVTPEQEEVIVEEGDEAADETPNESKF